tara:strand:- start:9201 stop:9428 length:228 start_codon:yes stop_codon:yes gene_type:complete
MIKKHFKIVLFLLFVVQFSEAQVPPIVHEKYKIGYASDHKLSTFEGNFSSHEIIFHLDFGLKRNTRWLLHDKCYF